VLLLSGGGLVKTVKFKTPRYLGDPVNIVKIFNDKGADEIMILDIEASHRNTQTDTGLLSEVASEAFMPLCSGGGIKTLGDIETRLGLGFEKVALSSIAFQDPSFVQTAAERFGSSTIVVVIDARNRFGRYEAMNIRGTSRTKMDPVAAAQMFVENGAGEIVVQSIDRDGTMNGYDLDLLESIASAVSVPVVALGGAGKVSHLSEALSAGASAVAAGSMFVFHGRHNAVLVSYPSDEDLEPLSH